MISSQYDRIIVLSNENIIIDYEHHCAELITVDRFSNTISHIAHILLIIIMHISEENNSYHKASQNNKAINMVSCLVLYDSI